MSGYAFRQSVYLNHDQLRRARATLGRLAGEASVLVAALIDYRGTPLVYERKGSLHETGFDMTTLASLVAGQMAALEETVRMLGERSYGEIFVSGEKAGIYLLRVVPDGHDDLKSAKGTLLVVFDPRHPTGGMRVTGKKIAGDLAGILLEASKNEVPEEVPDFDAQQVAASLEDLFGDGKEE